MGWNAKKIFAISACLTMIGGAGLLFESTRMYADSSKKSGSDPELQNQEAMVISQNEPDKSSEKEKKDSSAEDKDPGTESQETQTKPDKSFVPSTKIDADYAISFPYDI